MPGYRGRNVPTLLSICISRYYPEEMKEVFEILDDIYGQDPIFIVLQLRNGGYPTIQQMCDFNQRFAGWWGLPHRIAAFTIQPELMR